MGTDANLRCDSETPFVACQFRSPTGQITNIGTRCGGSVYGRGTERIERICWVRRHAQINCCSPISQDDKSLTDKTTTVCGITIKGVQGADEGGWRSV